MKRSRMWTTLGLISVFVGACSYGPLYRGPTMPPDTRVRRLGAVGGTGTGFNAGIAAGRANDQAWQQAHACGADQVVDVYEEGDCIEPIRWLLFFLPHCSASVRGVAISYKAIPDAGQFQRCIHERTDN